MDIGNAALEIQVDGTTYNIDLADMTGAETAAFRQAVGVSPAQALVSGLDLDCIAGFVWIIRKRSERALGYQQVAKSVTWRNVELDVAGDDEAEEPFSPEA